MARSQLIESLRSRRKADRSRPIVDILAQRSAHRQPGLRERPVAPTLAQTLASDAVLMTVTRTTTPRETPDQMSYQ